MEKKTLLDLVEAFDPIYENLDVKDLIMSWGDLVFVTEDENGQKNVKNIFVVNGEIILQLE
jgi:hypothetical protein